MDRITKANLRLATRILTGRLTLPAHLGTTVMEKDDLLATPADELFGRFNGFLTTRPNGDPCFILLGRKYHTGEMDHLFAFYMHSRCQNIQRSEKDLVQRKLKAPNDTRLAVINIVSSLPRTFDLSLLIQTVGLMVSPLLMEKFLPYQLVDAHYGSRFTCFNQHIPTPDCNVSFSSRNIQGFVSHLETYGAIIKTYDIEDFSKMASTDFNVLIIRFGGHLFYLVNHRPIRTLMIVLPHCTTFPDEPTADLFCKIGKTRLSNPDGTPIFNHINPCRFYGDPLSPCDNHDLLEAVMLELYSDSNPLHIILKQDLVTAGPLRSLSMSDLSIALFSDVNQSISTEMSHPLNRDSQFYDMVYHAGENRPMFLVKVCFAGPRGNPYLLSKSQDSDSQETIVMSQRQLQDLIDVSKYHPDMKECLKVLATPPAPGGRYLTPKNDLLATILVEEEMITSLVEWAIKFLSPFTTTSFMGLWRLDSLSSMRQKFMLHRGPRFHFLLLVQTQVYDLIIIDAHAKEFTVLFGSRELAKGASTDVDYMADIEKRFNICCPETQEMKFKTVKLTSHFHPQYSGIHMMMATYYLARMFRYTVQLPLKIIYAEREFRRFCYDLCLNLSIENLKYNEARGLVLPDGQLDERAFRSVASPVRFCRSVVPSDQCPFCLRRYSKNLGAHMSAAHDKGAEFASHSRFK